MKTYDKPFTSKPEALAFIKQVKERGFFKAKLIQTGLVWIVRLYP